MKNWLNRFIRNEWGASAIIAAITTSCLMTFTAFTFDYGYAYYRTSEAQNAADAAAIAAAELLPVGMNDSAGIAEVTNRAIAYANLNGEYSVSSENIELSDLVDGRYTSVKVNIPCSAKTTIAKVIGINSLDFVRSAKAVISPCTATDNVVPLGVDYLQLQALIASGDIEHIYLKYGGGDGDTGSYGAIDLDGVKGGGANDFEAWLMYGYEGIIEVGEGLLPVEKGNMSGPTETAITYKYSQCTHYVGLGGCTLEHFDPDCPRAIKVLVIEKVGTQYVKVHGFALFIIEEVSGDEVIGSYVKCIDPGQADANANWDDDYGMYSISLVH